MNIPSWVYLVLAFLAVLLVLFGGDWIRAISNRRFRKFNTYRVIGEKTVPAFEELQPKPTTIFKHLLPEQHVVITETVTFYRIEVAVAGWIKGDDVDIKYVGNGLYEIMDQYGVLLVNDEGKETGEYLPSHAVTRPVEQTTFGYADELYLWIDMANLKPVYRV